MIPVLNAVTVLESQIPSGQSRPWLIVAQDSKGALRNYFVKLFSNISEDQYQPTNKEIYAHFIAKEFDLRTPDIALIRFSSSFLKQLDENQMKRISQLNRDLFFGSAEVPPPTFDFSPVLSVNALKGYQMEMIFCFDMLIRNVDRRIKKPNILLKAEESYLIDHEGSLNIESGLDEYLADGNSWQYIARNHIFYQYLLNSKHEDFVTFSEYLKSFSLVDLQEARSFLIEQGIDTSDFDWIEQYLMEVKSNRRDFYNHVLSLL